jgi:hypothetical protein
MSIQDVSAEQLAKLFHHYQEALTHDFNCPDKADTVHPWDQTPQNKRNLMVAAARLALLELAATAEQSNAQRRYFAKPGEADWGC